MRTLMRIKRYGIAKGSLSKSLPRCLHLRMRSWWCRANFWSVWAKKWHEKSGRRHFRSLLRWNSGGKTDL